MSVVVLGQIALPGAPRRARSDAPYPRGSILSQSHWPDAPLRWRGSNPGLPTGPFGPTILPMNSRNLAALCFLALASGGALGQTNFIVGDVTNSATWAGTNLLSGTVNIRSNAVVTIAPGAR